VEGAHGEYCRCPQADAHLLEFSVAANERRVWPCLCRRETNDSVAAMDVWMLHVPIPVVKGRLPLGGTPQRRPSAVLRIKRVKKSPFRRSP
jgi:hypothetical protein